MAPVHLPVRKQRLREVDLLAQGHTASEQGRLGIRSQASFSRDLPDVLPSQQEIRGSESKEGTWRWLETPMLSGNQGPEGESDLVSMA